MASLSSLVLHIAITLCFLAKSYGQAGLQPGGRNVMTTYRPYYVTELTSVRKSTTRETCSQTCKNAWCWGKKTVCRDYSYYRWGYAYRQVRREKPVYYCKSGWEARGSECTTPICSGGCRNGGVCASPNYCRCARGWTGSRCRRDINECSTNRNGCNPKSGCRNTLGSYTCTCRVGYNLMSDQRTCKDIDECSTGRHRCGSNTRCVNNPGSFTCPCIDGYTKSSQAANSCQDIDECVPSSGVAHGCQMKCNNYAGGYECSCNPGYYLTSNRKDCSDHDECAGNSHGCQHRCLNTPGGYECSCSRGYRLNNKDSKTCDDINECSEGISGCAQGCINTIGGLTCSCNKGYRLGKDRKSCNDIDECSEPKDYCNQNCSNTPGSYKCTCRPGFDLLLDGKTCKGRPCFPIHTPVNGMKLCSGYTTEESCSFECLPGYHLGGSTRFRTCGADKQWTGNDTQCKIINCGSPVDPSKGFVYSPCTTHYGSKCSVGCNDGYFINDTAVITCDANGSWKPNNVSCKEIKVCEPNPCLRGGVCSVVSADHFTCDCTHTGYIGKTCDIGSFTIAEYPTLTTRVLSPPITVYASPPTEYVDLHIVSRDLEFTSTKLVFKRDGLVNQSFQIIAQFSGHYFIQYSLSGPSAGEFQVPEEDIIFVNAPDISAGESPTDEETIFSFPIGCHKKQLRTCPRSNDSIIFSSTSPFVSFGPLTSTQGAVSIEVGNTPKTPLSLVGINLPNAVSLPDNCEDSDVVSFSTESLVKSRILAKTFIDAVADSFPDWIRIRLSKQSLVKKSYTSELKTFLLTGNELRAEEIGEGQPVVQDTFYSLLMTSNLNVTIQDDVDIFKSNALYVALELCGALPSNVFLRPALQAGLHSVNNISILKAMKKFGWEFKFYSFQFSKTNTISRMRKGTFWDGYHFFNVEASSDGSFAVVSTLKKQVQNSTFADVNLEFEGTMIGNVEDVNEIFDAPFTQHWNVDLYGKIDLSLVLRIEGESVKLSLKGAESIGYGSFGGYVDEKWQPDAKRGLFFTSALEKDPFVNSVLGNFVETSSNRSISCFLNVRLYNEKRHSRHTEITDGFSCFFRGGLKFGSLKFRSVDVSLFMGNLAHSSFLTTSNSTNLTKSIVELSGTSYTELTNTTHGIFKHILDSPINVRFFLAQDRSKSMGSFQAICNIFGIEKLINVSISHKELSFEVSGKLYGSYAASMNCSSRLSSWENQVFDVEGRFENDPVGTDLRSLLKMELDSYAANVIVQATKRLEAGDQTVERARARLDQVMLLNRHAFSKLQNLTIEYSATKRHSEFAQEYLKSLENEARNYSKGVEALQSDLNTLCERKQCKEVCQEGILCSTCYEDVIGNSMGMCPATCFKTEQQRVTPFSEVVHCDRPKCKRIHNTNGFLKRVFGKVLGGIVKTFVSFGVTAVATAFGTPPPLSSALGKGLVTFLDTGRADEAICAAGKKLVTGFIGGPDLLEATVPSIGQKGVAAGVGIALRCQREQKDGRWKCKIVRVECTKDRFEYKYEQIPYICEQSCVIETVTKTVEKSCCKNVPCASFVVNATCVAENVLCKKTRMDALEKQSNATSHAVKMLKTLEDARINASYWKMKKARQSIKLQRAQRRLNSTQEAVVSLGKAYNSTIESRKEIIKLLSRPLRIKPLLNEQLTAVEAIRLQEIRFQSKVSARSDNPLFSIDISFQANGTSQILSTVLDFSNLNTSLRSIAKEILSNVIEDSHSSSRKKRSVVYDPELSRHSSIKKYHRYCAEFKNYRQILYDVASSLHNLSSEVLSVHKTLSQNNGSFALTTALNTSLLSNVEHDLEMLEAMKLQQEATQQGYEVLNSTTELLVYNWYATMENIFESTSFALECTGMNDCIVYMLDRLSNVFSVIEADGVDHIRKQIKNLDTSLDSLSNAFTLTVDHAADVSFNILNILNEIANVSRGVVCAQSPNITKHPNSLSEMSTGDVLVLRCEASGTALRYSWKFNEDVLEDQISNVLKINHTTVSDSGNYTCEVSNHIATETSTPAVVIAHPPPIIAMEPAEYLAIILSDDDSLNCAVKDNGRNISYQWWFKSANSSSMFSPLKNETFPYLNFAPMKAEHEGWYYCEVSNTYGVTYSRKRFVKALSFTLPVPTAVLSFSVVQKTRKTNSSNSPSRNSTGYGEISSGILAMLLSHGNFSETISINSLLPIKCQFERSKKNTSDNMEVCSWQFQRVGRNATSNFTVHDEFKISAGKVINASKELQENIASLVRATNNGALSFPLADDVYHAEKNSIAVQKFSLMCPRTQSLAQEDFRCVDCPPGYYAELAGKDQMAKCIPCPVGFYQTDSGKSACNKCRKGFTTENVGAYEHGQCKVICQPGHYAMVKEDTGYCLPCPLNQFQPRGGQAKCLLCPSNHVTHTQGASDLKQCTLATTEQPTKTTATHASSSSSVQTTTGSSRDERTENETDTTEVALIIGLSVLCFILMTTGVVILIWCIRRSRQKLERAKYDTTAVGCSAKNSIYDEPTLAYDPIYDEPASSKTAGGVCDPTPDDSKTVETDGEYVALQKKEISTFKNPVFNEISGAQEDKV